MALPNTNEFFQHTAHYASQARGIFRLTSPNGMTAFIKKDAKVELGFNLLKSGIITTSTTIPPQQLSTYSAGSFIGPTRKVPYGQIFSDVEVQFLLIGKNPNESSAIYYALTKWQEFIAGPTKEGQASSVMSDYTGFAVRYYDDYVTDAKIQVFSPTEASDKDTNTPEVEILLTEAFPITIGPLHVAWNNPDAPLSTSVTFAYHYMQVNK